MIGYAAFGTSDPAVLHDEPDQADEWPYCECGEDTTEGEEIDGVCACCGKALR